jgi:hypothetical protein
MGRFQHPKHEPAEIHERALGQTLVCPREIRPPSAWGGQPENAAAPRDPTTIGVQPFHRTIPDTLNLVKRVGNGQAIAEAGQTIRRIRRKRQPKPSSRATAAPSYSYSPNSSTSSTLFPQVSSSPTMEFPSRGLPTKEQRQLDRSNRNSRGFLLSPAQRESRQPSSNTEQPPALLWRLLSLMEVEDTTQPGMKSGMVVDAEYQPFGSTSSVGSFGTRAEYLPFDSTHSDDLFSSVRQTATNRLSSKNTNKRSCKGTMEAGGVSALNGGSACNSTSLQSDSGDFGGGLVNRGGATSVVAGASIRSNGSSHASTVGDP